jgi:hypothetical protein
MGQAANRNAPCPCGSGRKLKNCCIDKPPPAERRRRAVLPVLLIAGGIGLGVFFGVTKSWTVGLTTGVGGLILAVLVIVVRDPPPPGGTGDSAGINFGA